MKWFLLLLKELIPVIAVVVVALFSDFSLNKFISNLSGKNLSPSEIRVIDMGLAAALCRIFLLVCQKGSDILTSIKKVMSLNADITIKDINKNSIDKFKLANPEESNVSRIKIGIELKENGLYEIVQGFILKHTVVCIIWQQKWLAIEYDQIEEVAYKSEDGMLDVLLPDLLSCRGGIAVIDLTIQAKHKSTESDHLEIRLVYKDGGNKIYNYCIEKCFINCNKVKCKLYLS